MKPDDKLITLTDNKENLEKLLSELVLEPRICAMKWSFMTKQTPNIKIGYPGQHIASLITGMVGERTGARGNDLKDGSEVKSCSRIDQLDKCKKCGSAVSRSEDVCPQCGSSEIKRNDDSKWLFSIRSESELNLLTKQVPRVLLILGDYPNFDKKDFKTLRIQAYEIWPHSDRNNRFSEIMTNYYHNIYLMHKKEKPDKQPAPKNFWPFSYQFYICNPILVFKCIINDSISHPFINIDHYVEPKTDRQKLESLIMPIELVKLEELDNMLHFAKIEELLKMAKPEAKEIIKYKKFAGLTKKEKEGLFIGLDEQLRQYLPLRADTIAFAKVEYVRIKTT